MTITAEMTRTTDRVTVAQINRWLLAETVLDTPYGTAKLDAAFCGSAGPFALATVLDPWAATSLDPSWAEASECLQQARLFFTPENGWELSGYFLERKSEVKLADLTNPDVLHLSPEEKEVLVILREHVVRTPFVMSIQIDILGHVWCGVSLYEAKPEFNQRRGKGIHGRDFKKRVRALADAGLYVSHGDYELKERNPYRAWKPDGFVRVLD